MVDANKIGNLIYKLRVENNLTQKELATKLLVTSQAVSKWENGRGIPDIEMVKKLSEVFNIDIKELLNGEIETKKIVSKKKKKKLLYLMIMGIVLLIIISITLIKVFTTNDFKISKLASDNDSFHVKGIFAYSSNKKSIYISKVEYSKEEEKKQYFNLECILYEENGKVERKISECSSQKNNESEQFTLSELLKDIELNVDDYSCSCSMPVCNKLYLKINATNGDKEVVTYNIPLEIESNCNNN